MIKGDTMKTKTMLITLILLSSGFFVIGSNNTDTTVTPTPTILSQTNNVIQTPNQNNSTPSYTPVTSVPTDGSWVRLSVGRMRYADTPTPAPVNTPGPEDLQADINNSRVKFGWQPMNKNNEYILGVDGIWKAEPLQASRMERGRDIFNEHNVGYLFYLFKSTGEQIGVHYFNQPPLNIELYNFYPDQIYYGKIEAVIPYQIQHNINGQIITNNKFYLPDVTKPALIRIPHNFKKSTNDNIMEDIHVSLDDLYLNADKYDGKVIEVEGYFDRWGQKEITFSKNRSDGAIGDKDKVYTLIVEGENFSIKSLFFIFKLFKLI